jgi:hypothetical protein
MDGKKRKQLNIVMDNCSGQNKNNTVVRLATYLVEKGFFGEVNFIFLVVGHTKNIADRLFNTLKKLYRKKNIFSMGMLTECLKHEQVIPCEVDWRVFMDWDKYLSRLYKKMSSVVKWQMFQSSTEIGGGRMFFKSSNVENAKTLEESLKKPSVVGDIRNGILMEQPQQQYAKRPGLREIKQVEMYKKYRSLVPVEYRAELCPQPAKEVLDREKTRKNAKSQEKRDVKKAQLKPAPSPPSIVAAATSVSSCNDQGQELTAHGTTNTTTAPSSPFKRSRENSELE